ncbi:MAG: DUF4194 domain-containing protein [Ilumatobacteraceae bacterium]
MPVIAGSAPGAGNELGQLVVPLFKGVVYRSADPTRWLTLGRLQGQVRDYVAVVGLELVMDDAEGYAFLRTPPGDDDEADESLPRLVSRRRLTYGVSLLLALLRKRLAEADTEAGDARLVLTREEIVDLVSVFQPTSTNEVRLRERVEADVNKVVELGFLQQLRARGRRGDEQTYEVRRVLKAFVDAQWMADFDARLAEYRAVSQPASGGDGDE